MANVYVEVYVYGLREDQIRKAGKDLLVRGNYIPVCGIRKFVDRLIMAHENHQTLEVALPWESYVLERSEGAWDDGYTVYPRFA